MITHGVTHGRASWIAIGEEGPKGDPNKAAAQRIQLDTGCGFPTMDAGYVGTLPFMFCFRTCLTGHQHHFLESS
jgi:hypothetical protein